MHYRGNASPAKDRNATAGHSWFDFIHDLVQDLVDRYGIEEVRQWRFEHYNEPSAYSRRNRAPLTRLHAHHSPKAHRKL
jgi:beta-xylosidase